jgi:5-methylcytosine-specific restriction endonuclease McrA
MSGSHFKDYRWISNGVRLRRIHKSKSIPEGWTYGGGNRSDEFRSKAKKRTKELYDAGVKMGFRAASPSAETIEKSAAKRRGIPNPAQAERMRLNNPIHLPHVKAWRKENNPIGRPEVRIKLQLAARRRNMFGSNNPNWKGGLTPRRPPGFYTQSEWLELKERYHNTCPCCHRSEPEIKLEKDHIVPVIQGGWNIIENIQPLCVSCNRRKHTQAIKYRTTRFWSGTRALESSISILVKQLAFRIGADPDQIKREFGL